MNDTTKEMHDKQMEIILSKTPEERFKIGIEMSEAVYRVVKNSIKKENPNLSEREVVAELFKRYYGNEFSKEELHKIVESIKSFEANA